MESVTGNISHKLHNGLRASVTLTAERALQLIDFSDDVRELNEDKFERRKNKIQEIRQEFEARRGKRTTQDSEQ